MKKLLALLFCVSIQLYAESKDLFENTFHSHLMEVGWSQVLDEIDRYSSDEQRHILSRLLISRSGEKLPRDKDSQNLVDRAQRLFLAKSDHADYYQEHLESIRKQAIENEKRPIPEKSRMQNQDNWIGYSEYYYARVATFETLSMLPSAESVKVLGHFLSDPEGRDGVTIESGSYRSSDYEGFPPNCSAAAKALMKLGIANRPDGDPKYTSSTYFDLKEVEVWQEWWNEIVAGKRTYHFIGSDIEYGPDGPASPEQLQKIERDHRRVEAGATRARNQAAGDEDEKKGVSQVAQPASIIALITSCLLLAFGIWYFFRRRLSTK